MFINVTQIDPDGLAVDCQVRPHPLSSADGRLIPFEPVALRGVLEPRRKGYRFQGGLKGAGTLECSRCLEPFRHEFQIEFDLFYSEAPPDRGREGSAEDREVAEMYSPIVDKRIDLSALASEQIYLNLPLKPLCASDCRGLCPDCGANRNLGDCGCTGAEERSAISSPRGSHGSRNRD